MKKLCLYILSAVVAVSCQISGSSEFEITSLDLLQHANNRFCTYVTTPVELTELMISFDKYLSKSETGKEADERFKGHISTIYDNIYQIKDYDQMGICCVVDTKGKSLKETAWEFASVSAWFESGNMEYQQGLIIDEFHLPESTFLELSDEKEQIYSMSYDGLFETKMRYLGEDNGRNMWEVSVCGQSQKEGELYTVFGTSGESLKAKERPFESEKYPGNSYEGEFYVGFMRNDKRLDFCKMTFRHGFTHECLTSRD